MEEQEDVSVALWGFSVSSGGKISNIHLSLIIRSKMIFLSNSPSESHTCYHTIHVGVDDQDYLHVT